MNLLKTHKPNLEYVTQGLLKQLGVKVNARSITQSLQDHPHYPSLLAISDCLNDWYVENQTYNIPRAEYDRDDLLFPFLAHLKEDGGRFILILNIADDKVYYADEKNNHAEITEAEFLNRWDGIALHAEKTGKSGENEYKQNQLKYFLQSLILPLGLLIALSGFYLAIIATGFSWPFLLMNLVKLGGVAHKTNTDVNRYRLSWPCVKGRQNLQKGKKYYEKVKINKANFSGAQVLTRAQLKNVMGGFDEGVDPPSGKCGVNIYGHGGEKIDEMRGMTKTAAISYINTWNTSHQGWCTTNCNAVAKWCCASC